jgi:hypothetical protein
LSDLPDEGFGWDAIEAFNRSLELCGMNSLLARMFILPYTSDTDPKGCGVAAKHVEEGKPET